MYKYYNANPNKDTLPDCVTRAIHTALDIPYHKVVLMLYDIGDFHNCDELCVDCYEKLLDAELKLPHYVGDGSTIGEVASIYKDNILIIRTNGHLSCSLYGIVVDIWDCTKEECTDFWIVE